MALTESRYDTWKTKLLDLGHRNRLLYFKDSVLGTIELAGPDSGTLFKTFVVDQRRQNFPQIVATDEISLLDDVDSADITAARGAGVMLHRRSGDLKPNKPPKDLARALQRLRLQSRSTMQEQGVNTLFMTLGMLEWREARQAAESCRSPLLLVPVVLEQESADKPFVLSRIDEDVVLNPSLVEKLRGDFGITLPDLPEDLDRITLDEILSDIQHTMRHQGWHVTRDAWVGQYAFTKLAMFRDLEAHAETVDQHLVAAALAGLGSLVHDGAPVPRVEDFDRDLRPLEFFPVSDADSSQIEALVRARAGHQLVIQGPPGTGKSQTITNLIADQLALGRKVLFVSQKMAALEVVYRRLKELGLGSFCLEAHSHKASKGAIVRQLGEALTAVPDRGLLQSEAAEYERLYQMRHTLNQYSAALHSGRDTQDRTVFTMLGRRAQLQDVPDIPVDLRLPPLLGMSRAQEDGLRNLIRKVADAANLIAAHDTHPWRGAQFPDFSLSRRDDVRADFMAMWRLIDDITQTSAILADRYGVAAPHTLEEIPRLRQIAQVAADSPLPPTEWITRPSLAPLTEAARAYLARFDEYHHLRNELLHCYQPSLLRRDCSNLLDRVTTQHADTLARFAPDEAGALGRAMAGLENLSNWLGRASGALKAIQPAIAELAERLGYPAPATLWTATEMARLAVIAVEDHQPLPAWLSREETMRALEELAGSVRDQYAEADRLRQELSAAFAEEFFSLPVTELAGRFATTYRGFLRGLKGGYRADMRTLRATLRTPAALAYKGALAWLEKGTRLLAVDEQLRTNRSLHAHEFGPRFLGQETDWDALLTALHGAKRLLEAAPAGVLSEQLKEAVLHGGPGLRAIRASLPAVERHTAEIRAVLEPMQSVVDIAGISPGHAVPEDTPFTALEAALASLRSDLVDVANACAILDSALQPGVTRTARERLSDLRWAVTVQTVQLEVDEHRDQLLEDYGAFFAGMDTRWPEILAALGWAGSARALFPDAPPPDAFVSAVSYPGDQRGATGSLLVTLNGLWEQLPDCRAAIHTVFPADVLTIAGTDLTRATFGDVLAWLNTHINAVDEIQPWLDFLALRQECDAAGVGGLVLAALGRRISPADLPRTLEKRLVTRWLDEAYRADPRLASFRAGDHEHLISEFRDSDRKLMDVTARRITAQLAEQRPQPSNAAAATSEMGVLMRETRKKRAHLPVRRLFERIPHLLLDLTPCLLMSPLSVATFLPRGLFTFDVVIFDEASQIAPEEAIGAILRGKQLIVAGDNRQLPPTRFFMMGDAEADPEAEETASLESILDECAALPGFDQSRLRWHYRSHHESLIAFSNGRFYDNGLITFPGPHYDTASEGVRFVCVPDGRYDRGKSRTNRVEARKVAGLVCEHVRTYGKERSLGVIAFSQAQELAIRDELDLQKRADPTLAPLLDESGADAFFVKSIENVQGDERDCIILSVGYGPDADGKVALNFGPISQTGGERRLNVAFTRARLQNTLVASMQPEDMDLTRLNRGNTGITVLQEYLYYARDGRVPIENAPTGAAPDSPFEEAVATALRTRGLEIDAQVGCSGFRIDLAVRDPQQPSGYALGIECDGATYHSAKTARDRDRLRQQVLEKLGWRIHRIWSTDWIADPEACMSRVLAALAAAMSNRQPEAAPVGKQEGPQFWVVPHQETEETATGFGLSTRRPFNHAEVEFDVYRPLSISAVSYHQELYDGSVATIAHNVKRVLDAEAPIHEDALIQRVAALYGLQRTGDRIRERVELGIREAARTGILERRGEFLWAAGTTSLRPRRSAPGVSVRPVEQVPLEELRGAAAVVLRRNYGTPRADLITQTAREMGYDRTGSHVTARVSTAIDSMLAEGEAQDNGDLIVLTA